MVQKNEMLEKTINKNYGVVQKKENELAESIIKMTKDFSTNTNNYNKTLKQELKIHIGLDSEIKKKYVTKLKEINSNDVSHLKDIESRIKDFQLVHQKELKESLDKLNKENAKLNNNTELLKKEHEKQIFDIDTKHNNDIENSENEKNQINVNADKDINNLQSNLKETQDKYETLVVSFNEKRDAKLEKLKVTSAKKIEKHTADIEKEQLKTDKNIIDLKPPFEEKLAEIEKKLAVEKEKYQKKEAAIKSTLESKVARHEKFMNKSMKDNDQRAVKQHKKEISVLEKNAERELRLFAKEHGDRYNILNNMKKEIITKNLNKIASFENDFVNFKENRLYQIEQCKVTLTNDLEVTTLKTKQQLEDELNKYNEYFADNDRKQVEVIKQKEMDIEKQVDIQANLKIAYDKVNQINEVKHQESLSLIDKQLKNAEITKSSEEVSSKLVLDVALTKIENERLVAEKELIQSIRINEENELIEYHDVDFNKQASINNEYLSHQKEYTGLCKERADSIFEYEEIELNNRYNLKEEFLKKQKAILSGNYDAIVNKINQVYESEKSFFDLEINKLAQNALEELAKFEEMSKKEIKIIVDKRNALDPRAYKKEIKSLDREISDKKENLELEIKKRNAAINSKTALFNTGIKQATSRQQTALNEVKVLENYGQSRFDVSIQLIEKARNEELANIKERLSQIANDSKNFFAQATDRNRLMTQENTEYQKKRIQKEEIIIKDTKTTFEQEKHSFTNALEHALAGLDNLKNEKNSDTKSKLLNEEELFENKIKNYDSQIKSYEKASSEIASTRVNDYRLESNKINLKYENHLKRVSSEHNVKIDKYKVNTVEIDRETNAEQRTFETAKKQIKKNHDDALAKGLATINQKLQQDIRNI